MREWRTRGCGGFSTHSPTSYPHLWGLRYEEFGVYPLELFETRMGARAKTNLSGLRDLVSFLSHFFGFWFLEEATLLLGRTAAFG